jgi:ligand-binding sensor protein
MKLTDIWPLEKWVALEKEIHEKSGLDASVFDINGIRITDYKKWVNRLCPVIKANEKGQSYICAVAHQNLATMAKNSKKPVVMECDAGLLKIIAPLFVKGEFMGAIGGCGLLMEEGETDAFLVNKTTDIEYETIEELSAGIGFLTEEKAQEIATFLEKKAAAIAAGYES